MKKEFKDTKFAAFLDKVIPVLGDSANAALKIAKGDFAGAVGDVVGIFNKEKASDKKSSPEVLALAQEFEMFKLDFESEMYELEVQDRNSARNRQIEMAKAGGNDIMMILTGSVGLASFGGIVLAVIFMPHLEESSLFNQLMGFVFGVAVSNIFAFYFGTSKSSQDKTKLLAR